MIDVIASGAKQSNLARAADCRVAALLAMRDGMEVVIASEARMEVVIASKARQSTFGRRKPDCFVAALLAMTDCGHD